MSFIRRGPVDISKYLPAFLSKSPEMKANLDAESREHERIRVDLIDIANQFNVKTAKWGLGLWEKIYAIPTDPTLEYDRRQGMVLSRIGVPPTVNEEFLTRLVNNFVADGSGKVLSYPAEYRVGIRYNSGELSDYAALARVARIYLPAHLGLSFIAQADVAYKMFAIESEYERETLSEEIKVIPNGEERFYMGVGSALTRHVEIRPAEFSSMAAASFRSFATGGIVDREVLNGA